MNLNTWQEAGQRASHTLNELRNAYQQILEGDFGHAVDLLEKVKHNVGLCLHDASLLKRGREEDMEDSVRFAIHTLKGAAQTFRTRMAAADCADLRYEFTNAANRYRSTLLIEHPGSEELKPHDTGTFRITKFIGDMFWYGGVLTQEVEIEFVLSATEQIDRHFYCSNNYVESVPVRVGGRYMYKGVAGRVVAINPFSASSKKVHWRSL